MEKNDYKLLSEIAEKASILLGWEKHIIFMDLSCLMEGGYVSLDLEGLLEAKQSDLVHDIVGINQNLNRSNGKLENCFYPRYAK